MRKEIKWIMRTCKNLKNIFKQQTQNKKAILLFNWRCQSENGIRDNFHKQYNGDLQCRLCMSEIDNQSHLIKCTEIQKHIQVNSIIELVLVKKVKEYVLLSEKNTRVLQRLDSSHGKCSYPGPEECFYRQWCHLSASMQLFQPTLNRTWPHIWNPLKQIEATLQIYSILEMRDRLLEGRAGLPDLWTFKRNNF